MATQSTWEGQTCIFQLLVIFFTIQSLCYTIANARVISKEIGDEDKTIAINLNINLNPKDTDNFVDEPVDGISSGDLVEVAGARNNSAPFEYARCQKFKWNLNGTSGGLLELFNSNYRCCINPAC